MVSVTMRILVVEDESKVAQLLVKKLSEAGYSCDQIANGDEAFDLANNERYDVLLVDVTLPGRNGFELIEELRRAENHTPIIFLSAKRSTRDRVEGLRLGADDYIVKPFAFVEVLARIEAVLKRSTKALKARKLKVSDLELDLTARTVKRGNKIIQLHPREFTLLEFLLLNINIVVTKNQVLTKVCNYDFDPQTNVVDVMICRIRAKVDRNFEKKLIITVRGIGYTIKSEA